MMSGAENFETETAVLAFMNFTTLKDIKLIILYSKDIIGHSGAFQMLKSYRFQNHFQLRMKLLGTTCVCVCFIEEPILYLPVLS